VVKHINKMPIEQVQYLSMLTKSSSFGTNFISAVQSSASNPESFLRLDTEKQLKVIQNAALVHACVTTVASAFQEAPLVLEERGEDGAWRKTSDETPKILRPFKFNPDLSESEIMQYSAMNLELSGRCFLWVLRNGFGEANEIWPIPSSWVTIILKDSMTDNGNGSRIIAGYEVRVNNSSASSNLEGISDNERFYVSNDDMIEVKFPSPWNLVDALSPIAACAPFIDLEGKATSYTENALENLNLPGILIKTDRQLSEVQKGMLRAAIADKVGMEAAKSTLTFSGKDMAVDMLNPLESFGWSDFHQLNETRICMAFKVPPIVIGAYVGLKETTGWASGDMREAKKWLYRNTVHGLWKMMADKIGRNLIKESDRERMRIAFDATQVPELQEERGKLEERASLLFNASMVTLNEAREMMLMKAINGGDVIKTNLSNIYIPTDRLPAELEEIPMDNNEQGTPPAEEEDDDELEVDEAENEGK